MTPKEKAKELINKFKPLCVNVKHTGILDGLATVMNDDFINLIAAKQCALIAVDEIIEVAYWNNVKDFYREVKQEIEKYNHTKPEIDLDKVIKVEPKLRKDYSI